MSKVTNPSSSRVSKKLEALYRMKALKVFPAAIEQFREDNLISISEPPNGAFFWAEDEDMEHIREFEEKYDALVYMVVRTYTKSLFRIFLSTLISCRF